MNSLHFWCAEAFFSMTLHLWVAFFKGTWRHGRGLTWVSGMMADLAAIGTAFADFLSSPDEPPLTLQQYARQNPVGFVTTAMKELTNTVINGTCLGILDMYLRDESGIVLIIEQKG